LSLGTLTLSQHVVGWDLGIDQLLAREALLQQPAAGGIRPPHVSDEVRAAIILFASLLDEQQGHLYAGLESLQLGRGGDRQIAELLHLDPHTVAKGRQQLLAQKVEVERVRHVGGGRKRVEKKTPAVIDAIHKLMERVTAGDIRRLIRQGVRDISEIKALTRTSMGSCGAKTCTPLIHRLFREEGVPDAEVVDQPKRPLFVEVPLGILAGFDTKDNGHDRE
jgi:hypothetical protein